MRTESLRCSRDPNRLSDVFDSLPLCVSLGSVLAASWASASLRGKLSGRDPEPRPPEVKLFWKLSEGLRPHQGVQEEDGVVGHEADDEDGQVDQNHPEDALLAVAAVTGGHRTPQRSQDERGAYQVLLEKPSKHVVALCLLFVVEKKVTEIPPPTMVSHTAAHTSAAFLRVRTERERNG
ncbi:hypothetical protein EYF80_042053 [Liparis tanakae]|uniref:Uncharacterized protein n=1 Tax=Liparis tanakae TaxID=230148 RepID=A0A4Z2G4M4_9TELE|nr:hypothetical protein EYF80_042053 [Liparis tanakae]